MTTFITDTHSLFWFTSLTPQTALRIQSLTTRDQAITASGLVPVVW